MSYSYRIIESPLPVANYASTIAVEDEGGTTIVWTGKFDAKGAPDADAIGVIEGIYQGGLDSLAAKVSPEPAAAACDHVCGAGARPLASSHDHERCPASRHAWPPFSIGLAGLRREERPAGASRPQPSRQQAPATTAVTLRSTTRAARCTPTQVPLAEIAAAVGTPCLRLFGPAHAGACRGLPRCVPRRAGAALLRGQGQQQPRRHPAVRRRGARCRHGLRRRDRAGAGGRGAAAAHRLCRHRQDRRRDPVRARRPASCSSTSNWRRSCGGSASSPRAMGRTAPVALRVNPDVDAGTHEKISTGRKHDKFGIPYDEAPAVYELAARLDGHRAGRACICISARRSAGLEPFEAAYRRGSRAVHEPAGRRASRCAGSTSAAASACATETSRASRQRRSRALVAPRDRRARLRAAVRARPLAGGRGGCPSVLGDLSQGSRRAALPGPGLRACTS